MIASQIHLVPIVVASLVSFVFSWLYFSPAVAGNAWMKSMGVTPADMEKGKKEMQQKMAQVMVIQFLSIFVSAFVLAHMIAYAQIVTAFGGILMGGFLWLGFVATTTAGSVLWDKKSWTWWFIMNVQNVITMMVMGAIIAVWR